MNLPPDFKDLLAAFAAERVDYLLIGGYAVAFHGRPRFGVPPARVDILRDVSGVTFPEADARRVEVEWDGVPVRVLALQDLLAAKRAAGREQDIQDVRILEAMDRAKPRAT